MDQHGGAAKERQGTRIRSSSLLRPVATSTPTLHSCLGSCVLRSQKRTVVSPLPLASWEPSGEKFTDSTDSEWPEGGSGRSDKAQEMKIKGLKVSTTNSIEACTTTQAPHAAYSAAFADTYTAVVMYVPNKRAAAPHARTPVASLAHLVWMPYTGPLAVLERPPVRQAQRA